MPHSVLVSVEEWLDAERGQTFASQHARADSAKLVVTFLAGIAVTITATALQVVRPVTWWVKGAVAVTFVALVLTVLVIVWDRLKDPDHEATLTRAVGLGRTEQEKVDDLRLAVFTVMLFNEDQLRRQRSWVPWQVAVAMAACVLGAASLLVGSG